MIHERLLPAADPLAHPGFSGSAFSADCKYACVALSCEQPAGSLTLRRVWGWVKWEVFELNLVTTTFMNVQASYTYPMRHRDYLSPLCTGL